MAKKLNFFVLGAVAMVLVVSSSAGAARATIISCTMDHKSVATAPDHSDTIVKGSVTCTPALSGDTVAVEVLQSTSGTFGFAQTPVTCTGSAQPWSVDVPVSLPPPAEFSNGPATALLTCISGSSFISMNEINITGP